MAAARELFIYYRCTLADASALRVDVLAFQRGLQVRHAGLVTRLLRRPEPADGWQTWMETYSMPGHPDGVSEALEQEIGRVAAASCNWPAGTVRHVEVFVPCAS